MLSLLGRNGTVAQNRDSSTMTFLTLERALAIVEHAEREYANDGNIRDAFAPFARGGASTRDEAVNALYLRIADWYRMASAHGTDSPAMQEFYRYASLSESIAMSLSYDAIQNLEAFRLVASQDKRETVESFVRYLRSLDPKTSDFFQRVYDRLGLIYPADPEFDHSPSTQPRSSKPWWQFW